jgi:hypothetical protein
MQEKDSKKAFKRDILRTGDKIGYRKGTGLRKFKKLR